MSFPLGTASYPRWNQNYIPTAREFQSWFSRKADNDATNEEITSLSQQVSGLKERVDELPTIKDYGAVGDGTTDDTAAFNAVIAAQARVYVPAGNYKITATTVAQNWQYFDGPGIMVINGWTLPASRFVSSYINLPVPALFPTIQSAMDWFNSRVGFSSNAFVSIDLADGTYPISEITIRSPWARFFLQIYGNPSAPGNVQINADMTNNQNAFSVRAGSGLSFINGLTITGVGAWKSHGVWNDQCFGTGILADDGSYVSIGANVVISKCYYGVRANYGSTVLCASGVTVSEAGDVGFHAFGGSTLIANSCTASLCSDVTDTSVATLGTGFMAEGSSFMDVSGSTSFSNAISGFTTQNASGAWAHGCIAYSNGSHGFQSNNSSSMECSPLGTTLSQSHDNTGDGYHSENASFMNVNSAVSTSNTGDGFFSGGRSHMDITAAKAVSNTADGFTSYRGSTMLGNGAVATSNGQYGFQANMNSLIQGDNLSAGYSKVAGFYAITLSVVNLGTGWCGVSNPVFDFPETSTFDS